MHCIWDYALTKYNQQTNHCLRAHPRRLVAPVELLDLHYIGKLEIAIFSYKRSKFIMLVVPAQCRNEDGNSNIGKLMHLAISNFPTSGVLKLQNLLLYEPPLLVPDL